MIAIKGMEIPKRCSRCIFSEVSDLSDYLWCRFIEAYVLNVEGERPKDCPLMEIHLKEEDEEMVEYVHKPEEIAEQGKLITFENKTGLNNLLVKEIKKLEDMLTPASNLGENEKFAVRYCILILKDLSVKAEPEQHYDEWCTDCKEYDRVQHCCPRWNHVIRQAVDELKQERKTEKWIPVSEKYPTPWELVWVTDKRGHVNVCQISHKDNQYWYDEREYWMYEHDAVVAWMPYYVPEPYEVKE